MSLASTLAVLGLLGGFNMPAKVYRVSPDPRGAVAADVNGDGKLDLVVAYVNQYNSKLSTYVNGGVSVLLGNGKGGFTTTLDYAVGSSYTVVVGDINGDGKPDIVVGNGKVLLNNGSGGFSAGVNYYLGGGSWGFLSLTDVNGDGKLDIITNGSVQLGNGDGTFGPAHPVSASAVGDINGDGKLDLVAGPNWQPGNGDGSFGAPQNIGIIGGAVAVDLGDFDGNGALDVAYMWYQASAEGSFTAIAVFMNNGNGTFTPRPFYLEPFPDYSRGWCLASADFNHDGKTDLLALNGRPYYPELLEPSLMSDEGNNTFLTQITQTPFLLATGGCAVGDFNGDGLPDLAVVGKQSQVGPRAAVFLTGP